MAVSTDHNPGTSPALSLLLMANMACTLFRLTVPEALAGITQHAARALGLQDTHGLLAPGRSADFVLWPVEELAELAYCAGPAACMHGGAAGAVVIAGKSAPNVYRMRCRCPPCLHTSKTGCFSQSSFFRPPRASVGT